MYPLESVSGWVDENTTYICRNFGACFTLDTIKHTIPPSINVSNIYITDEDPDGLGYKCIVLLNKINSYKDAILHGKTFNLYSIIDTLPTNKDLKSTNKNLNSLKNITSHSKKYKNKSVLTDIEFERTETLIKSFSQCSRTKRCKKREKCISKHSYSYKKHSPIIKPKQAKNTKDKIKEKNKSKASRRSSQRKEHNVPDTIIDIASIKYCMYCDNLLDYYEGDDISTFECRYCITDIYYSQYLDDDYWTTCSLYDYEFYY
jgi:hypothetical protein